MSASAIVFYLLSAFILSTGIMAVSTRKIFRSAIWLLFSLIGIAGLFFWMNMEFIAAVQVVVYAGGIVVLIIFSIFLTQQSGNQMERPLRGRMIWSILSVLAGFAITYSLIHQYTFRPVAGNALQAGVSDIGTQLLNTSENGFVLPFEVVSILLLAAMIGCIVIAMKVEK
jgi:NADH-quinone oxidoreductase subunit J